MKRRGLLVSVSILVILAFVAACAGEVITPTASPSPTTGPTTGPVATTSPTTKPTTGPTTPATSPAQPQVIKWRGQTAYPVTPNDANRWPGYPALPVTGGSAAFFVEWVKNMTDGRLIIDLAPPASIVPVADMMTAVENGTLDFAGLAYGGFHTGIIPEANIEIGLPFAWENPEEAWDGYYHWGVYDLLKEVYAKHNIWPLPFGMGDLYHFGTTFDPSSIDSIKGKKIRALGIYGNYVQALGGSPSTLPWGELYMSAKLGTIDGYIGGPSGLEDVKLKEVLKYYVIDPNPNTIGGSFYFSQKALDALPADIKKLLVVNARFVLQGWAQTYYIMEHRIVQQTALQGYTKPVKWSAEDTAKARQIGFGLWDEVAAKSATSKKLVDLVKAQMKDLGKM